MLETPPPLTSRQSCRIVLLRSNLEYCYCFIVTMTGRKWRVPGRSVHSTVIFYYVFIVSLCVLSHFVDF